MIIRKSKLKIKFLPLVCIFGLWTLVFGFNNDAYALNLDKLKASFISGDYKSAIQEGERILAGSPSNYQLDELYYLLGLSYLKDGNYLRASDIFEIVLKEFKQSRFKPDAKLGLGDTYFLRGDYQLAQQHYQELISHYADTKIKPLVYYRLNLCAARIGDTQQAEAWRDKLKQEFPSSLETNLDKELGLLPQLNYTVQVGSFVSQANAKNLSEKLARNGYTAYIVEMNSAGVTTYRVRVGKLSSLEAAQELERKLSQEGYPTKICP